MKNRDIYWTRYKTQETLYLGQWCLSLLQGRHNGTSHSSPSCHQLPFRIFQKSHWWSEISPCSKVIVVLGKARRYRVPNLGYRGLHHLADLMFAQKMVHEKWWMNSLLWWSCWSTVTCSYSLLSHLNSFHGGMFNLMQNLMQICPCTQSVILNVMATQYTCSLSGVYCPHWLVQWSRLCSCMCIPVHSPGLPAYISDTQTVFIILTMARLFLDRPLYTIYPLRTLYIWRGRERKRIGMWINSHHNISQYQKHKNRT